MEDFPVQVAVPVPGFPSPLCYDPARDQLGSGGASVVFRATVTATAAADLGLAGVGGRVYALKQFRQPRRPGEDDHANETAMLAALSRPARHPHIQYGLASWTGGGTDPSTPPRSGSAAAVSYLLFELAPGGDLWAFLRDTLSPAFPPEPEFVDSILAQMQGLCDGLAYVHDCALEGGRRRIGFHHDLKTCNILLCSGGGGITPSPPAGDARHPYVWKLGDFGCGAVNLVPAGSNSDSDGHELSSRPASTGDPIYTAPELIVDDKLGWPKDVWALGCVFLEVLVWALAGASPAGPLGSNAAAAATPAVEAFRHARDQYCHLSPENAPAFWCIDPVSGQPFVNPAATAAAAEMAAATRRCEPASAAGRLAAVLDVVSRRMVVVEKEGRASAAEVRDRLAALRGVAR